MTTLIPDLGPGDTVPKLRDSVDVTNFDLTAAEMFVLTRIDGHTTLQDISLATGIGEDETFDILKRLLELGVVDIPQGDVFVRTSTTPPPRAVEQVVGAQKLAQAKTTAQPRKKRAQGARFRPPTPPPSQTVPMVPKGVPGKVDLPDDLRKAVDELYSRRKEIDLFELLDCPLDASPSDIRRAYALRAKRFHPDRYYGKKLGPYKAKLETLFTQSTNALQFLLDDEKREAYGKEARIAREKRESAKVLREKEHEAMAELNVMLESPPGPKPTSAEILKSRVQEARKRRRRLTMPRGNRVGGAKGFYKNAVKQVEGGKLDEALSSLRLAAVYDPKEKKYLEELSEVSEKVGYEKAAHFSRLADLEEQAKRFEPAAKLWGQAAAIRPKAFYHQRAAESFLKAQEFRNALGHGDKAIELEPNDPAAHIMLARIHMAMHADDKARAALDVVQRLDPNSQAAGELRAWLSDK